MSTVRGLRAVRVRAPSIDVAGEKGRKADEQVHDLLLRDECETDRTR